MTRLTQVYSRLKFGWGFRRRSLREHAFPVPSGMTCNIYLTVWLGYHGGPLIPQDSMVLLPPSTWSSTCTELRLNQLNLEFVRTAATRMTRVTWARHLGGESGVISPLRNVIFSSTCPRPAREE